MTKYTEELDAWTARQLLWCDAATGRLHWKPRARHWFNSDRRCAWWNSRYAGKRALTSVASRGYLHGRVLGGHYKAHRVIWLITIGEWPDGVIDHIDGNPANNTIENLRSVSMKENLQNQRLYKVNASGVPGVRWIDKDKGWEARIGGKYVGWFKDKDKAIACRRAAEIEHGYHPNHGRVEDEA